MHFAILALGSRGDVQPFVALGCGLRNAGHAVTLAAAEDYAQLVTAAGLPFVGMGGLIREQMDMERVAAMLDGAGNPVRFALDFLPQVTPLIERIMRDAWAASHTADAVLASTLGLYPGLSVAEKRGVPLLAAHFHPLGRTSDQQHPNFPPLPQAGPASGPLNRRMHAGYNRATHLLGEQALWQLLRSALNRARRKVLGLPALGPLALARRVHAAQAHTVYGYSTTVAPLPPGTPANPAVTGYWFLPRPAYWQPDAALAHFLAEGPPPVYVGFGSNLTGRNPDRLTQMFVAALQANGLRGLLHAGWGDFGNGPLPATVLRVAGVPHDWLFPQTAGVVHHGGAGVTAAALAAGIPAAVMPFLGDQFYWAQRVHALGCGPPPLVRRTLTTAQLTAVLADLVNNGRYRERARIVAQSLAGEDGVGNAVAWITRTLG